MGLRRKEPRLSSDVARFRYCPRTASAPSAPTNLAAVAGDTQVSLTWDSVASVTWNVYRGTSAGAESGTPVTTGLSSANYTDTGLTNGTTYYYVVKAVNAVGTSAASNEASTAPVSSLLTGLLAWWKLDEATGANRLDSSGNSITLTDVSSNVVANTGLIGSAAGIVTGQAHYLKYSAALITSGSLTFACWVKIGATGLTGYFVVQGATNTPRQRLSITAGDLAAFSVNTATPLSVSTTTLTTGAWYHLVGTYDGTTQKLYVNGALEDSDASTASFAGSNNLTVGGLPNGTSQTTVDIDLVGVWSRALTIGEIATLYNAGAGKDYPF